MVNKTNGTRRWAILLMGIAALLGWINPSGRNVYAQYYCSLTCSASAPATGKAGDAIGFRASATTSYCDGEISYRWEFGDGASASSSSASHIYSRAGTYSWSVTATVNEASASRNGTITISSNTNALTGVSAASYNGSVLAGEAIVAVFGTGLATATEVATTLPLPTSLAGTQVQVKDSAGVERLAPLFFVSAGQLNCQLPQGTAAGSSQITVTSGNGTVSAGAAQIANVAPGFFSGNASGQGVASGYVLRVKGDNSQSIEPIAQYDTAQSKFVALPIDLGAANDQVYLILFSTGLRSRSSLSAVSVKIGGADAQVLFAGPQGDFVGLDQVNLLVPRSLLGRGDVDIVLMADNQTSNIVQVRMK